VWPTIPARREAVVTGFVLNGEAVEVDPAVGSLLDALREELGIRSAKDGCSPQGQCGCCTVWVDGRPRVACVTPVGRVRGRYVTTLEGLPDADRWAEAFCATGASQCGFCTPGIVMRLAALPDAQLGDRAAMERALLAHLCRCTGWQTILESGALLAGPGRTSSVGVPVGVPSVADRDLGAASHRATIEGRVDQRVAPSVALGRGGFAGDTAPPGALVAVLDGEGEWVVDEALPAARARAGKIPGRRTTAPSQWPLEHAPGEWAGVLRTTWVEPAYLEPDAAWCAPGGVPAGPLGNGGAFGGKSTSSVGAAARRLADRHGRPVRVLMTREDTVRHGPKRPPVAIGVRRDGTGVARLARPTRIEDEEVLRVAIAAVAPGVAVELVDVVGPPVSAALRGAGWAEVAACRSGLDGPPDSVVSPDGAEARAVVTDDGTVEVTVRCGAVLDETVLRSYCIGAAHMALGMVRSERLTVGEDGTPLDLTIRSFGVLRATDTPRIVVHVDDDGGPPVNGSDAVFAAVLAAAWRHAGHPPTLPRSG
jgi:aerobic-type carbon monoxide dehydrogenase small subunit (CoxS/CutS family)